VRTGGGIAVTAPTPPAAACGESVRLGVARIALRRATPFSRAGNHAVNLSTIQPEFQTIMPSNRLTALGLSVLLLTAIAAGSATASTPAAPSEAIDPRSDDVAQLNVTVDRLRDRLAP